MVKHPKRNPESGKDKYQPTAQEQIALDKLAARAVGKTLAPRLKASASGNAAIDPDHPNKAVGYALLMEALGTTNIDFVYGLLRQLINAGSRGHEFDESGANFMLAVVKDVEPRDQLEAMLAAQMAAVHVATMTFARRLDNVDNIPQQDSAERAFNKLARTFATQMEALKRYRTGGEQKVTVQHVSVSEGGQAIVGNVTQTKSETATLEKPDTSPVALTDARQPSMAIVGKNERKPVQLVPRKKNGRKSPT